MSLKKFSIASLASFAPLAVFAQSSTQVVGIVGVLQKVVNVLIPLFITAGVAYFIWGVVQYVVAGDEKTKDAGRHKMIYGIIGLFVIVSIWGLISFLQSSTGIDSSGSDCPSGTVYNPATDSCMTV
ncbi:MAG: pilin [Candidatus Paceibacterota bacterium]|jgi:hypothetical protein